MEIAQGQTLVRLRAGMPALVFQILEQVLRTTGLPSICRHEKGFVFELVKRSEANIPGKRNRIIKLQRLKLHIWVANKSMLLGAEVLC